MVDTELCIDVLFIWLFENNSMYAVEINKCDFCNDSTLMAIPSTGNKNYAFYFMIFNIFIWFNSDMHLKEINAGTRKKEILIRDAGFTVYCIGCINNNPAQLPPPNVVLEIQVQ